MGRQIKIEELIRQIWDSSQLKIVTEEKNGITRITEQINFVYPELQEIQPATTGPFIIISAPGAVGKTTFAKFSAYKKKGYYWDLSKIKLGDNSFIGTLAKSFGPDKLTTAIEEIAKGNISFFIDAFDEAEIISGFDGIEKFVKEIYSYCKDSTKPNIIFFSRSETANLLELVLQEISITSIPPSNSHIYSMYEIDYFNKENSIQFIKNYLKSLIQAGLEPGEIPDFAFERHPEPFNRAVDNIFRVIGKGIDSNAQDIWGNDDIKSFIGYAPVLQTITSFLKGESNYEDTASRFQDQSVEGGVKVISDFIGTLLDREQGKFLRGLKEKVGISHPEWNKWESIYSADKQIEILLRYVANNRNIEQLNGSEDIPDWLHKDYLESLSNFLPNHPFLKTGKYSSPAFRDYTLGKLINNPKFYELCKSLLGSGKFVLTQLFSIFYSKFNGTLCYGPHVGYLYESVASRLSIDDNLLLTYIKPTIQVTSPKYSLEILNTRGSGYNNINLECIINETNPLVFERRLHHATIDIKEEIILGKENGSMELSEVTIKAKRIKILAKELIINCQADAMSVLISDNFNVTDYSLALKVLGKENFRVSFPGSTSHPWTKHNFTPSPATADLHEELYALKRILESFRKHGKEDFGKYVEFIDNRIVKGSIIREDLFKYLLHVGILKRKEPMYIMDELILNNEGINWSDLKSLGINDGIYKFLLNFKEYQKN